MSHKTEYIWTCKIGGPAIQFQSGADAPMRQAVQAAFKQVTGNDEVFCFSGWGGELTEIERAIVENRLPSDERAAVQAAQPEAVGDGATIAGLESAVGHLSTMVDEQRRLLVEVEQVCGRDAYGMEFEDGDSELIDKVRAHLAATTSAPTPEPMSAPTEAKPAQDAVGAPGLDDEDLATLEQIDQDFDDAEETTVDYAELMRFARMGYLECTHFTVTSTGRAAISAKKGGA